MSTRQEKFTGTKDVQAHLRENFTPDRVFAAVSGPVEEREVTAHLISLLGATFPAPVEVDPFRPAERQDDAALLERRRIGRGVAVAWLDSAIGCQNRRRYSPMGVPGPTRVSSLGSPGSWTPVGTG